VIDYIRFLDRGVETLNQYVLWGPSERSMIAVTGGAQEWAIRREDRPSAEIEMIVQRVTPWRVVDERLVIARGSVHGRVTRAGAPVSRAYVLVASSLWRIPYPTRTDAAGRYRVDDLPDGDYVVRAESDGRKSTERFAVVSYQTPATLDLELPAK
jgi:hypothetical protein